jgi:hypothetical protein
MLVVMFDVLILRVPSLTLPIDNLSDLPQCPDKFRQMLLGKSDSWVLRH